MRVPKQCKPLGRLELEPVPGDPFGPALDWAYRCYQVLSPAGGATFRSHLYLFNVLVALEWEPSAAEFEQLQIGFRRASDFLFDATDGWMAFGQVVFGGPELMDGADIQMHGLEPPAAAQLGWQPAPARRVSRRSEVHAYSRRPRDLARRAPARDRLGRAPRPTAC